MMLKWNSGGLADLKKIVGELEKHLRHIKDNQKY